MPVRVLYVIETLASCGTTDLVFDLARGLDAHRFAPAVLALRGESVELRAEDERAGMRRFDAAQVPCWALTLTERGSLHRRLAAYRRWLSERRPSVLHAHSRPADLWSMVAGLWAGVPVRLYSRHATCRGMSRATALRYAVAARAASGVVAVSEAVERHLLAHEHALRSRVRRIYDGVDFERIEPTTSAEAIREKLGVDSEAVLVGCVASLEEPEGQGDLLEAFPAVRAALPEAHLVLVGDGTDRDAFRARAQALGLADAVSFTGWREDVSDFLAAFDLAVHPSRRSGFDGSLLAAAGLGTPLVVSHLASHVEMLGSDGAAYCGSPEARDELPGIEPRELGERIVEVLGDRAGRQSRARRARTRVRERFDARAMAREHEHLYEELLARSR